MQASGEMPFGRMEDVQPYYSVKEGQPPTQPLGHSVWRNGFSIAVGVKV